MFCEKKEKVELELNNKWYQYKTDLSSLSRFYTEYLIDLWVYSCLIQSESTVDGWYVYTVCQASHSNKYHHLDEVWGILTVTMCTTIKHIQCNVDLLVLTLSFGG